MLSSLFKVYSAAFTLTAAILALTTPAGTAQASETTAAAPTAPATGVSTESVQSSSYADIVKNLYVNYFATVHGTPLNKLDSPYTLDHNGKNSKNSFNAINFDSDVTAAYMVSPDLGFGAAIPFILTPVQGQGVTLGDLGIKAVTKNLFNINGVKIFGSLYLQAPTSQASQDRGMDFGVKSTPAIRYSIPGTRFTIGSWNEVKWYSGVDYGKTLKLLALPYINYSLTKSLSLNLQYEFETDHMKNDRFFNFTTYETDIQPGVVWFINSKMMVNPYVQIFTGQKITSDRMALGAVVSATVL
ncbi:MAG: hypothetical protein ACJ763_16110 [Bdellovibrionia bacterium]